MQWIGDTKLASATTMVICGDHSWRVPFWRKSPMWAEEDEKISGGKFDPRPLLMVHFPGETTPKIITQRFPALQEHDLIELMLRQPETASGLADWARSQ